MKTIVMLDESGNEVYRGTGDYAVCWAGSANEEFPDALIGGGKIYGIDYGMRCRMIVMIAASAYKLSRASEINDVLKARLDDSEARP